VAERKEVGVEPRWTEVEPMGVGVEPRDVIPAMIGGR